GIRPGVLFLVLIAALVARAGFRPRRGVDADLQASPVNEFRERFDVSELLVRPDATLCIACALPAVIDVDVDVAGLFHAVRGDGVCRAAHVRCGHLAGEVIPTVPAHGGRGGDLGLRGRRRGHHQKHKHHRRNESHERIPPTGPPRAVHPAEQPSPIAAELQRMGTATVKGFRESCTPVRNVAALRRNFYPREIAMPFLPKKILAAALSFGILLSPVYPVGSVWADGGKPSGGAARGSAGQTPAGDVPPNSAFDSYPSEMQPAIQRFESDLRSLERVYPTEIAASRQARLREFYTEWLDSLAKHDFSSMGLEGKVDYVLFRNQLQYELRSLDMQAKQYAEMEPL